MFLATTALSEFWDTQQELLCLGTWCLRAGRRADWQRLTYRVMPSPWNDRKRFYEATRYVDRLYETLLERLTDYLNAAHGVSRNRRYWRILLGPWLMQHIHQMYDRYVHVRDAFDLDPGIQTIVLDRDAYTVPRDSAELARRADDDLYNLQLISQVLAGLGYRFPARRPDVDGPCAAAQRWRPRDLARRLIMRGADILGRGLLRVGYSRTALCDIYGFPPRPLILASALRAVLLDLNLDGALDSIDTTPDRRRKDLAGLPLGDEFERILVGALPQNLPTLYMEAFKPARDHILAKYRPLPAVILSSVGWHYNEAFKFLAAEATTERGTRLVAAQHGGGYGLHRFQAQERHEAAIADRFAVWGWADGNGPYENAPAALLAESVKRTRRRRPRTAESVLFVANENFRYVYRLHSLPLGSQHDDWFEWELHFLSAIPASLRRFVVFRPYVWDFDHGFAIRERVARDFPEVRIGITGRFEAAAEQSRLLVIDHCGTTLLQALAADIPTIAYWDPQRWEARDEAEPYLDGLRDAGVLWDSPEGAAAKVADVYDDVAAWWKEPTVEAACRRFASHFALTATDWPRQWVRLLDTEAALAPR